MSNHTKKQPKMYGEKYGQTPCTEYKALLGAYIIPPEQSAPAERLQPLRHQLFSDRPLLRWDNAPHYPALASAPHHFHDEAGHVLASPLSGEPLTDVPRILEQIDAWIAGHRQISSHPGGR